VFPVPINISEGEVTQFPESVENIRTITNKILKKIES